MPDDGSRLRDITVLADEAARLSIEVPVARLERLASGLAATTGTARGDIRFERRSGFPAAQVEASAEVTLACQRCFGPLRLRLEGRSLVYLPTSENEAERVPADAEVLIAAEGRLRPAELVEEELLLALPFAPLHAEGEGCAGRVETPEAETSRDDVQRPFAALAGLMGRRDS
ncbi:MAG: hypothetical protein RL026_412 [Pseudomonadota bacterium]|jgi:uncharacterized protein